MLKFVKYLNGRFETVISRSLSITAKWVSKSIRHNDLQFIQN